MISITDNLYILPLGRRHAYQNGLKLKHPIIIITLPPAFYSRREQSRQIFERNLSFDWASAKTLQMEYQSVKDTTVV